MFLKPSRQELVDAIDDVYDASVADLLDAIADEHNDLALIITEAVLKSQGIEYPTKPMIQELIIIGHDVLRAIKRNDHE